MNEFHTGSAESDPAPTVIWESGQVEIGNYTKSHRSDHGMKLQEFDIAFDLSQRGTIFLNYGGHGASGDSKTHPVDTSAADRTIRTHTDENGVTWANGDDALAFAEQYIIPRFDNAPRYRRCPHGIDHPRWPHSCDGCWCEGERDRREYGWDHDTTPVFEGGNHA